MHQTDHLIGISNLVGGSAGREVLVGNNANNVLTAEGGNDVLEAGGGNDTLIDGPGHAIIDASQRTDSVDYGSGTAVVNTDGSTTEAPGD